MIMNQVLKLEPYLYSPTRILYKVDFVLRIDRCTS